MSCFQKNKRGNRHLLPETWGPSTYKHFARFVRLTKQARGGGLKVDSSVMHDSGTAFAANSAPVSLTARSAFYPLRSPHAPRLRWFPLQDHRHTSSANRRASSLSPLTYNCVCLCVSVEGFVHLLVSTVTCGNLVHRVRHVNAAQVDIVQSSSAFFPISESLSS